MRPLRFMILMPGRGSELRPEGLKRQVQQPADEVAQPVSGYRTDRDAGGQDEDLLDVVLHDSWSSGKLGSTRLSSLLSPVMRSEKFGSGASSLFMGSLATHMKEHMEQMT